jgi:AcrR family transcriptional regulator
VDDRRPVSGSGHRRVPVRDRRAERTRRALILAFNEVLFERGYARVTVRDVIERANVGRSTFYEHFESKYGVLEAAMTPVLVPLADAVRAARADARLRGVVAHIYDARHRAALMLLGPTRPRVAELLARLIADRLPPGQGTIPREMVAAAVAAAQLGALETWLNGTVAASADVVAETLVAVSAGAARAVQSAR